MRRMEYPRGGSGNCGGAEQRKKLAASQASRQRFPIIRELFRCGHDVSLQAVKLGSKNSNRSYRALDLAHYPAESNSVASTVWCARLIASGLSETKLISSGQNCNSSSAEAAVGSKVVGVPLPLIVFATQGTSHRGRDAQVTCRTWYMLRFRKLLVSASPGANVCSHAICAATLADCLGPVSDIHPANLNACSRVIAAVGSVKLNGSKGAIGSCVEGIST